MQRKMTKFSLITSLLFSLVILTHQSWADETSPSSESNLNNFSYPNHTCGEKYKKPGKPARLASFEDVAAYNMAIAKYNIKVSAYNNKMKIYKSCINQYIKNGNQDINLIRQHLNAALKEARMK